MLKNEEKSKQGWEGGTHPLGHTDKHSSIHISIKKGKRVRSAENLHHKDHSQSPGGDPYCKSSQSFLL